MSDVRVRPVESEDWPDLERLLGDRGGHDGCWCSFWRLSNAEIGGRASEDNRAALAVSVREGARPGLIARADGVPVGWCSVSPRRVFTRVRRTRAIKPVPPDEFDDASVWAVTCFFVAPQHRNRGIAAHMLAAAVRHADACGARRIEGYPIVQSGTCGPALSTGTGRLFEHAGFVVDRSASSGRRARASLDLPRAGQG